MNASLTRRNFLRVGASVAAGGWAWKASAVVAQTPLGDRPRRDPGVEVLGPLGRVPLSFFIDDSTCLVNMGHFCMPQFLTAWGNRNNYHKPWKTWPREIPDAFLREFGEWCGENGVKGKFSIVPYPACVGWLDRELPGWSRKELLDSLDLVRRLMTPHWDIHPEMISHTRVIDIRTGRPMEEISSATMENSYPQTKKSVDELAAYMAYALRILQNCGFACEGITTPGGFGNLVKTELSQAVGEAVRDVFRVELPHYFKYVSGGSESSEPRLEHVADLDSPNPRVVANVPAGTGDWFGSWDGDSEPQGDRYATADGTSGRLVELVERGQPAVMLCHWPGLYSHGTKKGFEACKQAILGINGRYADRTLWMKISEIARYWTAKELTRIERNGSQAVLKAPFASPRFTIRVPLSRGGVPWVSRQGRPMPLAEVAARRDLKPGSWCREDQKQIVCFDLPKGETTVSW